MNKPLLIGDFLHRIKRPIELCPDSKYKLVTIKMKHKGVVLRQEKLGAAIKSNMYQVKAGDFILSGIDARNGAFGIVPPELDGAIVTNDFWYFDIDEAVVDKHLFLELTSTKWFDEICRKGSDGTTERIRLQKNKFFNQTVFLPPLYEQQTFIERFKRVKSSDSQLKSELTHQQALLKKLRQQILQEAIEGKLTADWRKQNSDVEPASKLLERIAAEKKQLIKEKKIKKQKSLPPISDEEKPFELPKGWEWCHIGDLASISSGKGFLKSEYAETGVRLFQIANVSLGETSWEKTVYVPREYIAKYPDLELFENDLVMALNRPLLGKSLKVAQLKFHDVPAILYQRVGRFDFIDVSLTKWIFLYLRSSIFSDWLYNQIKGVNIPFVNQTKVYGHFVPMPSKLEQIEVVGKVDKLFAICDQLEAQVTESQAHAEQLMQAVLKEAFQSDQPTKSNQAKTRKPGKTQNQDNLILFNPSKAGYDKRMLLAAEIVHQLHKQPTLGHLKLQKLIYLCQKIEQMQLPTNFLQQAAGPYDPEMARSLDKQLQDKKWFCYQREEKLKYLPLVNAGGHRAEFEQYFAQQKEGIHTLINLFRKKKSDHMEIVATLYACWERLLQENAVVSDEMIFERFYQWSEEKSKYPLTRLKTVIEWMCKQGIVPKDVI